VPSGFSGRHADGESGSPSSSSSGSLALGSAAIRGQAEVARDPAPLLRGFRKPATGEWLGTHFSAYKGGSCRPSEETVSFIPVPLPVFFFFFFTSWVSLYFLFVFTLYFNYFSVDLC
jgi:hypothetical protein